MAIFGAPQPHEDHAVRACLAALAMHDGMMRLSDPELQIRVGVHSGEVVIQAIEHGMYQPMMPQAPTCILPIVSSS
jgi:class 3 adenylate cyclase